MWYVIGLIIWLFTVSQWFRYELLQWLLFVSVVGGFYMGISFFLDDDSSTGIAYIIGTLITIYAAWCFNSREEKKIEERENIRKRHDEMIELRESELQEKVRIKRIEDEEREARKKKQREYETKGLKSACEYLKEAGYNYTDVSSMHCGYNLVYIKDGVKYYLIIKALDRFSRITITPDEYSRMEEYGEKLTLYILLLDFSVSYYGYDKYFINNPINNLCFSFESSINQYYVMNDTISMSRFRRFIK